jgi:hypothetical protein
MRQTYSGFITEDLLYNWVKDDFISYCTFQRLILGNKEAPIVVFCDGHSSRFSTRIWKLMKENNIILICIPSHSSHLLQVLDLYPNQEIKKNIQTIKNIKNTSNDKDKLQFLLDIENAVSASLKKSVIKEGFYFSIINFIFYIIIVNKNKL